LDECRVKVSRVDCHQSHVSGTSSAILLAGVQHGGCRRNRDACGDREFHRDATPGFGAAQLKFAASSMLPDPL
jgi:hypothetical protein